MRQGDDLFEISWWVPEAGFCWVEGQGGDGGDSTLQPMDGERFAVRGRRYLPLQDHPALFHTLADTDPTRDGILGFANRYGGLFSDVGRPERFSEWVQTILDVKEYRDLLQMARKPGGGGLETRIIWKEQGVYYVPPPEQVSRGRDPEELLAIERIRNLPSPDQFPHGDLAKPALAHIARNVEKHLETVTPKFDYQLSLGKIRLTMTPGTLRAAIWFQLAMTVWGDREFRQCKKCSTWFALHPSTFRTNRDYCSKPCRYSAYRERRRIRTQSQSDLASQPQRVGGKRSKSRKKKGSRHGTQKTRTKRR